MTLAAFNSDDKILNQEGRENLLDNVPFIKALARTRPIILMDEPQEGMDTENAVARIAALNPLAKIRYSATHKVVKNLLYRLTPYDSYRQNLVKKIEVLTVAEKNDEATLKIELVETQNGKGDPKAKLRAWKAHGDGYKFDETRWLKVGDNLAEATKNNSYLNYTLKRVYKGLRDGKWRVEFDNGVELIEKQTAANKEAMWRLQLEWLIHRHFEKSDKLRPLGIKCLSLIFIDRVNNYMSENAPIKKIFEEAYAKVFAEFNNDTQPTPQHVANLQGFYFAQTGKGEFTDSELTMRSNREIYDTILGQREKLISLDEPIEFIFSHSALGVGWDNPNVFNIATLNESFSEVKKRQEIGRGLRICVNQNGQRVYDAPDVTDEQRLNRLTVVPNETYESFVAQYQAQIKEVYGDTSKGAGLTHTHKGQPKNKVKFGRSKKNDVNEAFKRFWRKMAQKTDYTVSFVEDTLIQKAIERISQINVPDYVAEVSSRFISAIEREGIVEDHHGSESTRLRAHFVAQDFVEELSDLSNISLPAATRILAGISNHAQFVKNPPMFIHEASRIIRNVELEEMVRGLTYTLTGEVFDEALVPQDFELDLPAIRYTQSPSRGLWDKMLTDSEGEHKFTLMADNDTDVVCFLKLPDSYVIQTPVGEYHPDWGIVMKHKRLRDGDEGEFYFVVETKGTNDIHDIRSLKESEKLKIQCAFAHFKAIGIQVDDERAANHSTYEAPVRDYRPYFKQRAETWMAQQHG
jgi:type III restriction enzyme